jgi:hypothetical protein
LYGLKHSRLCNSFHTVIFGMPRSLLALATDYRGLRWNASRTLSMLPSDISSLRTQHGRTYTPNEKHRYISI